MADGSRCHLLDLKPNSLEEAPRPLISVLGLQMVLCGEELL